MKVLLRGPKGTQKASEVRLLGKSHESRCSSTLKNDGS